MYNFLVAPLVKLIKLILIIYPKNYHSDLYSKYKLLRHFAFFCKKSLNPHVHFTFLAHLNWTQHISSTQQPHVVTATKLKNTLLDKDSLVPHLLFFLHVC